MSDSNRSHRGRSHRKLNWLRETERRRQQAEAAGQGRRAAAAAHPSPAASANVKPLERVRAVFRPLPAWLRLPLWVVLVLTVAFLSIPVAPVVIVLWGLELLPSLHRPPAQLYGTPGQVAQEIAAWAERENVQPALLREGIAIVQHAIRRLKQVGPMIPVAQPIPEGQVPLERLPN